MSAGNEYFNSRMLTNDINDNHCGHVSVTHIFIEQIFERAKCLTETTITYRLKMVSLFKMKCLGPETDPFCQFISLL